MDDLTLDIPLTRYGEGVVNRNGVGYARMQPLTDALERLPSNVPLPDYPYTYINTANSVPLTFTSYVDASADRSATYIPYNLESTRRFGTGIAPLSSADNLEEYVRLERRQLRETLEEELTGRIEHMYSEFIARNSIRPNVLFLTYEDRALLRRTIDRHYYGPYVSEYMGMKIMDGVMHQTFVALVDRNQLEGS